MGFSRFDRIFSLSFPFPDNFDEMGSLMHLWWIAGLDSKVSGVDFRIEKHMVAVVP